MGNRHIETRRTAGRRGLAHLLAGSMVAAILVAVPFTPATAQVDGGGGCLDKLEIETPDESATTFGAVTLAPGETFRADIKHWTSAPTAATWRSGFNSEIRLSPMLDDGFPGYASTSQRDSFAADGPWDVDGFMDDGTFSYTNPSGSNTTSFVLEVSYWNTPAAGIVGRTEASGFSTCVSPHSPPDRPTRDCVAAPTLVANGSNVHSEPFEMEKNAYISMRFVDERPLRYDEAGNQDPLLRSDYLIRTWLYGRNGPDDSWHYIRRDSHRSQNNWMRGSYVGSWDISIKNRSDYTEVKVILGKWISRGYALSTPLDVSIKGSDGVWRRTCLESTKTTVTWDQAPSCAADDTARMQAQVTNKSGASTGYRISLTDPTTGDQVHASHLHTIDNGATGIVALGGIPTGTWDLQVYEQQSDGTETSVGARIRETFDTARCDVGTDPDPDPSPGEQPPSWSVAGLLADVESDDSSITLAWGEATADSGISGYEVRADDQVVGVVTSPGIVIQGLNQDLDYEIEVYAVAGSGKRSSVPLAGTVGYVAALAQAGDEEGSSDEDEFGPNDFCRDAFCILTHFNSRRQNTSLTSPNTFRSRGYLAALCIAYHVECRSRQGARFRPEYTAQAIVLRYLIANENGDPNDRVQWETNLAPGSRSDIILAAADGNSDTEIYEVKRATPRGVTEAIGQLNRYTNDARTRGVPSPQRAQILGDFVVKYKADGDWWYVWIPSAEWDEPQLGLVLFANEDELSEAERQRLEDVTDFELQLELGFWDILQELLKYTVPSRSGVPTPCPVCN